VAFSKEKRFQNLSEAVQHCTLCERLCNRIKVLSNANGNINSKVMFIAEAPGRLGADKTGVPLYGDKTGENFEMLLGNIGWSRKDIFITNALLCNPRNEEGNNSTPTSEEVQNCNAYLEMAINLVQPEVIVTLGAMALDALNYITPHEIKLAENVGQKIHWNRKVLIPLYHPGPRALIHRSLPKQRADFIELAKFVNPSKGISREVNKETKSKKIDLSNISNDAFLQCILAIVKSLGEIPYFKLTKLLYFVDLFALERFGQTITGAVYLRQQEGPWPPMLTEAVKKLDKSEIYFKNNKKNFTVSPGPSPRFDITLGDDQLSIIAEVLEKYGHMNSTSIKVAAYRSRPMRYILEQEKLKRDMRKIPVLYKDKTAIDYDTQKELNP